MNDKLRLAVFLSGSGSNFEAIARNCAAGKIACEVVVVVSNRADAYGLVRAANYGVPTIVCDDRDYPSRPAHEAALEQALTPYSYDLIALAGYMRLLTPEFVARRFNPRLGLPGVVNIHPADTKAYQGVHGYEFAMGLTKKGPRLSETKITVHFVDAGMDTGPVIAQRSVPIPSTDDLEALRQRGLAVEWEIYSEALDRIARGRVHWANGRVTTDDQEAARPR
jgi:phosphoribosylglycinamide formyltransferase-1